MVQNGSEIKVFKSVSFCKAEQQNYCHCKKDFLEIYAIIITLWVPPVFTTGGQWLQLYEITASVRFKIAPARSNGFEMLISYTLANLLRLPLSL